MPLGISSDQNFQQTVFNFAPGESWLVFADGVTNAMRTSQDIYGNKRLMDFLVSGSAKVDELVQGVVDDVKTFVEGRAQNHDICMVGFQRLP